MKTQLGLALSVALNGVLAVSLLHRSEPRATPAAPTPEPRREAPLPPVAVVAEKAFDWSQVESEDYPTFRDNLLAIGCPRETVRDIIAAELREPRAGAVAPPYWTAGEDEMRQRGARRRESEAEVRRLLAAWALPLPEVDPAAEPGEARTEFLAAGQQSRLAEIEASFQRKIDARTAMKGRHGGAQEMDDLARLDEERTAAIRATLTPAEYFEYQLRNSSTAQELRESTAGFQPTEAEFRQIYRITQQAEEQAEQSGGEEWKRAQLRAALGPQRAEAFVRSQDPFYQDVYAFVAEEAAPDAARLAEAVYTTRQSFQRDLAALGRMAAGDPQRAAGLQALRDRTRAQVAQQLGAVSAAYLRTAASWLE